MTWFFGILVVLALGAVAAAAAGRTGSMPESFDDRLDARLPAGPVTAEALRGLRLPLALRGYRMSEVDALLERLTTQLAEAEARTATPAPVTDPAPVIDPEPRAGQE